MTPRVHLCISGRICQSPSFVPRYGSPALQWDDDLAKVAQNHARAVVVLGYNDKAGSQLQSLKNAKKEWGYKSEVVVVSRCY